MIPEKKPVRKLTPALQKTVAEKLSALPKIAPQELSKKEFIAGLRELITNAQGNGYSLEQIAEVLKSDGVELSIPTLKTYLQSAKNKRVKKAAEVLK